MRPLKSTFPNNALTTLETVLTQTKDGRVFRRAQAVREVVAGQCIKAVSHAIHFPNSALRQWVQRFAQEGSQGLLDRPRPGRPRKVTEAVATCIPQLVEHDPLAHGALASQGNGRELRTAVQRHMGVTLHRDTIRVVLQKGA